MYRNSRTSDRRTASRNARKDAHRTGLAATAAQTAALLNLNALLTTPAPTGPAAYGRPVRLAAAA